MRIVLLADHRSPPPTIAAVWVVATPARVKLVGPTG